MRCFYHPDYYLPLPEGHPFPMEKFPDAYELVRSKVTVDEPMRLERADLERSHFPDYLSAVSRDDPSGPPYGLTRYARNRLGLPANSRLLERSALETAGTVSAALAALDEGLAANLAGGTHHAFPDKGLGFCVLNDVAVAIEYLRARGLAPSQTLILDTDAHQGNANHAYFRNDPSVFTYSIHVGKNYPSAKEPGDCDVPLSRWADGHTYLEALEESLPPVFSNLEPDLVFWISGADVHEQDRFGQLRLSDGDMARRDNFVLQICRDFGCLPSGRRHHGGGTAILYGGGYQPKAGQTGRIHADTILRAAEFA